MDYTNTQRQDVESCKICNGLGSREVITGGSIRIELCKCAVQALIQRKIADAGIPRRFFDWDLRNLQHNFRIKNKDSLHVVKRYISNLDNNIRNGKGLWVSSPPGLGKNQLLCYILRLALERNYSAYYVRARRILDIKMDSWRDQDSKRLLYRLTEGSNIVAVADIEKGPVSVDLNDFKVANFYDVLSDMDDCKTSLLISSNAPKIEVLKRMPSFMQARFRPLKEIVLRYSHGD